MMAVTDAVDADALRIRHEFLTLPDLQMAATACADLLRVSPRHASDLLESLAREGFLQRQGGFYARAHAQRGSKRMDGIPSI